MPEEPRPIGPDVHFVLRRTLILKNHADDVLEIRERAARVRVEMIAREVRLLAFDGFSPRLAEIAAKNNLALQLRALDEELAVELARLQAQVRRRLELLIEDLNDVE